MGRQRAGPHRWEKAKKGEPKTPAVLDKSKCIKCMTCISNRKFEAIY